MRDFIKAVFANLVAFGVMGVIFVVGGFVLLIMLAVAAGDTTGTVKQDSILVLDMNRVITDSPQYGGTISLLGDVMEGRSVRNLHLLGILDTIRSAKDDSRISGILIIGSSVKSGYGSTLPALMEIQKALDDFNATGKPIVAYIESLRMGDYLLTTVADEIHMNPYGILDVSGYSANMMYLGDALKRYGIGVQISQTGKYKTFGDMLTRTEMGEGDEEQLSAMLQNRWDMFARTLEARRGITLSDMEVIRDSDGLLSAEQALSYRLVDKISYLDQVRDRMLDFAAEDYDNNTFAQVDLDAYFMSEVYRSDEENIISDNDDYVAVVYVEGDIVPGEGAPDQAGADRIARHIRDATLDDRVRAIVLRINSPGGSAYASEVIAREVALAAQHMPVISSFGGYAASGGYWVASDSTYIISNETTVTGSIGVVGLYPNFQGLAENLSINFDGVKVGTLADMETWTRPRTEEEMKRLDRFIELIYDGFLGKVAKARKMTVDDVKKVAEGRVWTGNDAHARGLVDRLGGMEDALEVAASLGGLGHSNYKVIEYPSYMDPTEQLIEMLFADPDDMVAEPAVKQAVKEAVQRELPWLRIFSDPNHIYARMPYVTVP